MTAPAEPSPPVVGAELRSWLAAVADAIIPAGERMPAAADVDVAGRQLDLVLRARPDLLAGLEDAFSRAAAVPPATALDLLPPDSAARDALLLVVAGAYYSAPTVRTLLDYTGQTPESVRADTYPAYVAEGLLDRVLERGSIYRPTPAHNETEATG